MSSASASSSNSTATTTVASSVSASSVTMTEALTAVAASALVGQETVTASSQTPVDKGAGDPEAGTDADDEYEDVDEGKGDDSGSDDGSVSSSASGAKRRKRDKGVGMSIKSLRNASRHAKRARPVAEIKVTPGSRVATEVCYTFSLVTVMWQVSNGARCTSRNLAGLQNVSMSSHQNCFEWTVKDQLLCVM